MATQNGESEASELQWSAPDPDGALWQRILHGLPLGVALLEIETGRTLWGNRMFQSLLTVGTGVDTVIGLSPAEYLPELDAVDWAATLVRVSRELPHDRPTPRRRLQFVEHATRNIAYWEIGRASCRERV